MTAPILVAADPATVDHAPAHFEALVAGFTGAPVDRRRARERRGDRPAERRARRSGARLRVLVAVLPRGWRGDGTPEALDEAAADARVRAGTAAEAAAGGLLGAAVDVDVEVLEPAAWLLEVSADVDLLVCGSRGYGARPATLLGGVTRRLTAGASCPVIVLARGAEVPPEAIALAVPHRCGMQRRTAPAPSTRIEVDAGWVITVEALACAR